MRLLLIIILSFARSLMAHDYTVQLVTGNEINEMLPTIAQLWIDEYAQYPYLYKGTIAEGLDYFHKISASSQAAFVVAYDHNNHIIGFLSGLSLNDFAKYYPAFSALFVNAFLDPNAFYYASDVIVAPRYRHFGIAKELFKVLEKHAFSLGYTFSCLACESHPQGHPQKPKDYYELDNVWKKCGYTKTKILVSFVWDTIQVDNMVKLKEHLLVCWIKEL